MKKKIDTQWQESRINRKYTEKKKLINKEKEIMTLVESISLWVTLLFSYIQYILYMLAVIKVIFVCWNTLKEIQIKQSNSLR